MAVRQCDFIITKRWHRMQWINLDLIEHFEWIKCWIGVKEVEWIISNTLRKSGDLCSPLNKSMGTRPMSISNASMTKRTLRTCGLRTS